MKKITMSDIAKHAGVSQSTVSLILNGKDNVSFHPSTIERVYQSAQLLGYEFKPYQSSNHSLKSILVLSVTGSNPYYTSMQQSIECYAYNADYNVLTCHSYRDARLESKYLDLALKMNFAGIICLSYPHNPAKLLEISHHIPVVCICDKEDHLTSMDIVEMNHSLSGQLIIDHLVSLNHKKIVLLTRDPDVNAGRKVYLESLKKRLKYHDLDHSFQVLSVPDQPLCEMENSNIDYQIGYDLLIKQDNLYDLATAIVCMNDFMALGALDALHEKGFKVPEDFSICGSDNSITSKMSFISLTTIDLRMDIKGKSAFDLLMKKIDAFESGDMVRKSDIYKIEYQPQLIVRESTSISRRG